MQDSKMHRGQPTNVAIFAAVALLAILAAPMVLGRVYMADDLGEFHLPLREFYANQLSRNEPFDWCPDLYCGFYLTGEGQVGAYHPLHWLLYRTLPLTLAFDLECWLSYPAMLAGMVVLLVRLRLRFPAAMFGAISFTFGSFNFMHFVHPNAIAVIAHLPWLLWAIDVMLRDDDARRRSLAWAAVVALTGSQLLLGYPQYVFFSLMVEAGYVAFSQCLFCARNNAAGSSNLPLRTPAPTSRCSRIAISSLSWLAAIAVAAFIGGVQLLPTFDALQHSVRKLPAAELTDPGSLHPLNLVQWIGPYLFNHRVAGQNTHELAIYLGAAPLVLAILGAYGGMRQKRYRPTVIAALTGALFGLLWSLGINGPMGWLQTHFPLIDRFRLPCRAMMIVQLATATLAAVGFELLMRQVALRCNTKSSPASRTVGSTLLATQHLSMLILVSLFAAAMAPLFWPEHASIWTCRMVGPALIAIAVTSSQFAARGKTWALTVLFVLAAADLCSYGISHIIVGHTASLDAFIQSTNTPPGKPEGRVALDLVAGTEAAPGDRGVRVGNRILLAGWMRVDGYAGLEPSRRLDYRQPAALRLAGASWKLQNPSDPTSWIRLSEERPRAWLVTSVIQGQGFTADLDALATGQAAVVDEHLELPAGMPGQVIVGRDRPGEFVCQTTCKTRQLLFVNESYHSGWQAQIDGRYAEVLRVNADFLGVAVPAGEHEIRLQFRPVSLKIGRLLSGCGLGLLVAALLMATGHTRRQ
ncbi:MAG: YfhO family protein [Pirellulales bacterium]|nr:YfhO family protein [Pirellulales bacterium]